MIPGEVIVKEGEITLNEGRETLILTVTNTGDRPIQIGSHYHFFEANRDLAFDRAAAFGFRLDLPAGTAARFEAGQTHDVELVALGGRKRGFGLNHLTDGQINEYTKRLALQRAKAHGFKMTENDKE